MKRRIFQIVIFSLISIGVIGQINLKDLNGEWTTNNNDSSYFKSDTIRLYQDINYQYEIKTCNIINWKKGKRQFKIEYVQTCSEPGRAMTYNEKERIKLKKEKESQFIEITRNGELIDKFEIIRLEEKRIERNPFDIKILTLKREKATGR